MIVVIDGYNVMKNVFHDTQVSHQQRKKFIAELAQYLQRRALTGVVVFDGGDDNYPCASSHGPVTVVFSGRKLDADTVIKRYCDEHKDHELILVTSDHELRAHAHRLGKQSMPAHEFYHHYLVQPTPDTARPDHTLVKLSADAPAALDALMAQETRHVPDKDDHAPVRRRPAHRLSKKERVRERVLGKLR